jgi:hypothetical protein
MFQKFQDDFDESENIEIDFINHFYWFDNCPFCSKPHDEE